MIAILPMAGVTAISMVGAGMSFWEGFYFACFVAGLLLSVISLIGGMGHISWHFHPPHVPQVGHLSQGVAHHPAGVRAGSPSGRGSATSFGLACVQQALRRRVTGMPPVMDLKGNQIDAMLSDT